MSEENSYSFESEFTLEIQEKILSLLIFEPEWAKLDGLEIIKPEYFENKALRAICTWIHKYYKEHKDTPTKAVLEQEAQDYSTRFNLPSKDFYAIVEKIEDVYYLEESRDMEYFKQKAIDFVRQTEWKKALARGGDCFKKGNFNDAVEAFKRVLSIGSETNLGIDLSEIEDPNIILDAINGILSTHEILSLKAYNFLSAGAKFIVCEIILIPMFSTFFTKLFISISVLQPGIDCILSTVPPVKPNPLPDIFATGTPIDATNGNRQIDTLSPTPPVECLSTIVLFNFDKSNISPEFAIDKVRLVVSCFVIPFKNIAITNAAA